LGLEVFEGGIMMRKTLLQIGLLCIFGCGLISCIYQSQEARLQDGRTLEEQGNYIGAMKHYQRMPNPGFREVCSNNLRLLYGDILAAMIAQRDNPNSAETHYALGKAYYEKARSIPAYQEIVPNQGFDSSTYFAGQQARFYAQSQTALESATQLRGNYQDALLLKGNVYEAAEKPEKAVPVYQQLVDLKTESPEAYYQLGKLLYDRGQIEDGLQLAQQAIDMDPDNLDAHFVLGILYAREEADDQAIAEFHQVLCHDLRHQEAYYKIAQLYLRQNNLIDAERVLRLGLTNNPESIHLAAFYASLKAVLDEKERAEAQRVSQQLASATEEFQSVPDVTGQTSEKISPVLQLNQLRLNLNILKRQRPYVLLCAGTEEHPYFNKQITLIQEKIEKLEQSVQSE
jgi:tetratricopeptide (TPR) repeat protein